MVEIEQKRYADDITLQELVRLRVENERLREALQHIANDTDEKDTRQFALATLAQKERA